MTEQGQGSPVVLVPGIQGRWEWMAPAMTALAGRHRVLSFSLGEVDAPDLFEGWAALIDRALDRNGHASAALVGVSFGGLVAAYYAGERPNRVSRLVLVSAPSPGMRLDAQSSRYVQSPRLSMPFFAGRAAFRLSGEIRAGFSSIGSRARFAATHVSRVLRFPASPRHMAQCVRAWETTDLETACRQITAPTLVVTGEPALDRVVPVASTLEYLALIPGARHATLARTGHLGLLTRPREFAALVSDFIDASHAARPGRSA